MEQKIIQWLLNYSARAVMLLGILAFCTMQHREASGSKAATIETIRRFLIDRNGRIIKTLFSPQGQIKEICAGLMLMEAKMINVAMYAFTDGTLAQGLIDAYRRGVKVEIVVCRSGAHNKWSKVEQLVAAGIPVYVYPAAYTNSIMHCKFVLFHSNFDGRSVVGEGSYNWTSSADKLNCEHCSFFDDREFVAGFTKEFGELKKLSVLTTTKEMYQQTLSEGYRRASALS